MMSIFATRRDRPTTTARRARHAKPQLEGLEQIIALDGYGMKAALVPHAALISAASARSSQSISQTGSTINLEIEGNKGPVFVVIEADTLNFAVQQAKVTGTSTVLGTAFAPGCRTPVPVALQVTNTATASSSQSITQEGATVDVTIDNNKGPVEVGISANTYNTAIQYNTATVSATATTKG